MDKEQIAISAVGSTLSVTDHLVPHLQSGDKGVSWDGHVDVYKTAGHNHKKGELDGQAHVQVKGHEAKVPFKDRITFSIETDHLRNYLEDGGVVFFVVYFDSKGNNQTIYYNCLLPYDLKRYIKEAGTKGKKKFPLKRFPKDKETITEIFVNFLLDKRKQRACIAAEDISLEDLVKNGDLKSLSLEYASVGKESDDPLDLLLSKELFLYADMRYRMKYPLEHFTNVSLALETVNRSVLVGGKMHYSFFTRMKSAAGMQKIIFGKSIEIKLDSEGRLSKIDFTLKGTLSERIRDLEFIFDVFDTGSFAVAEAQFSINASGTEQQREKYRRVHQYLRTAKQALDTLGVKTDLDVDKMQEKDYKTLSLLIGSVVDGKGVVLDNSECSYGIIAIANLKILVSTVRDSESGKLQIYNFFDSPLGWHIVDEDGSEIGVPCCFLLNQNHMTSCCNITVENVMLEINKWSDFTPFVGRMIFFMLELIHAYDNNPEEKWLLELAHAIADAIDERDQTVIPEIKLLNKLQIAKRQRSLNVGEQEKLMSVIQKNGDNPEICIGAYLLLGQTELAEEQLAKLPEKEMEDFKSYPIYSLMSRDS